MYPKFIELHHISDGSPVSVNVTEITKFSIDEDCETFVDMTNGYCLVKETYDEVKTLITDAGCLINKADPRLDMTHPLSMDDLRGMVGEPVWNSNTGRWFIIQQVTSKPVIWLIGFDKDFLTMTADDLIKTPLYRMKGA